MIYRLKSKRSSIAWLCIALVFGLLGCNCSSDAPNEAKQHGDHQEGEHEKGEHKGHEEGGHDEQGETAHEVKLSPESIEAVGIEVSQVESGSLRDNVTATATVEHDVNRVAHIAPMVEGQITKIDATLGDKVKAGQTLAVMRSVALGEARSMISQTTAALDVARQNFERQQKLVDKGIASERSFIEARGAFKQAKARYAASRSGLRALGVGGGSGPAYPLKSHIDGTITEQHASVGETKGPQDELFVVADLSQVWVIGYIPEKDAHAVSPGMNATVTLDAYPDKSWQGTVDWIASTLDAKSRLLPIRVELENPEGKLKPGMFGAIHLSAADSDADTNTDTDTARGVALVPVDAVQQLKGKNIVFVPGDHPGEFRAQPVELGDESGGRVEVVSGLSPTAKIVTHGAFDIKAALTAGGRSAAHSH